MVLTRVAQLHQIEEGDPPADQPVCSLARIFRPLCIGRDKLPYRLTFIRGLSPTTRLSVLSRRPVAIPTWNPCNLERAGSKVEGFATDFAGSRRTIRFSLARCEIDASSNCQNCSDLTANERQCPPNAAEASRQANPVCVFLFCKLA